MISTLSCSIVIYRPGQDVLKTVACVQSSSIDVDLYIVDNSGKNNHGMADRIKWQCPEAKIIIPPKSKNVGFGKGHNLVRSQLTSTYHLFLNPDVTFDNTLLARMVEYMDENPDVGILSPKIKFLDGTEQFVPKRQPTIRYMLGGFGEKFSSKFRQWRDEYTMAGQKIQFPTPVECASGSFLLIRTHVYRDLLKDGFDPRYFMYCEDCDLCRQVMELAPVYPNVVMYHPDMVVNHGWNREDKKKLIPFLHHLASAFKYFGKWHFVW